MKKGFLLLGVTLWTLAQLGTQQDPAELGALYAVEGTPAASVKEWRHLHEGEWLGTGFAVSPHHIVTAGHVICAATGLPAPRPGTVIEVRRVVSGTRFKTRVAHFCDERDFCLLYSPTPLPQFLPVAATPPAWNTPLKTLGLVTAAEDVPVPVVVTSAVANPCVDLAWSASGVLTGQDAYRVPVLFTDKAGQPGFSGSPVLNPQGQVVGIHVGSFRAVGIVIPTWRWLLFLPPR